jgi:2-polyprenyl-3-methyl-5-hydroxy-6-metoxy-1,4-benzoquinol methylase
MMRCILCDGLMWPRFSAKDYRRAADPAEYILNWCDRCGFGRLDGKFSPSSVLDFYNIDYYTHQPPPSVSGDLTIWERLRCQLAWRVDHGTDFRPTELGVPGGRTVCDIGCGNGDTMKALKNSGFQVTGIEPDAKARSLAAQVTEVFDGTAEQIPDQIKERSFDIVLMSHVLEHCIDPHAAIKNVRAILRPGGCVIIEVPNNDSKGFSKFGPNWPWSDIPRHINFFTERSLNDLLRTYGFKKSSVRYVGYFRQFTPHWIATQNEIWAAIGNGPRPKFDLAAWLLLAKTAFKKSSQKYDSVRIHASYVEI